MGKRDKRGVPQSEIDQIAERLLWSREALGLTQAELCRRAGVKPNAYSQWEKGKGRPEIDKAKLLCVNLGYTLDWIYLGDMSGLPHAIASNLRKLAS
jgi:transcriptional regulator with XRE-family HTH domain